MQVETELFHSLHAMLRNFTDEEVDTPAEANGNSTAHRNRTDGGDADRMAQFVAAFREVTTSVTTQVSGAVSSDQSGDYDFEADMMGLPGEEQQLGLDGPGVRLAVQRLRDSWQKLSKPGPGPGPGTGPGTGTGTGKGTATESTTSSTPNTQTMAAQAVVDVDNDKSIAAGAPTEQGDADFDQATAAGVTTTSDDTFGLLSGATGLSIDTAELNGNNEFVFVFCQCFSFLSSVQLHGNSSCNLWIPPNLTVVYAVVSHFLAFANCGLYATVTLCDCTTVELTVTGKL